MKKTILILFLFFAHQAISAPRASAPRVGKYANLAPIHGAWVLASPTNTTFLSGPTSSTDPFSAKTNAYAESPIVRFLPKGNNAYVKFGTSTISAATTSDYMLASGVEYIFSVDIDYPYVRVISNTGGSLYVSEIY